MRIKNYVCKDCGSYDFFIKESGSQVGIYCAACGKYLKWANKNEQNLLKMRVRWYEGEYGDSAKWIKVADNGYCCSKCGSYAPVYPNGKTEWLSNFCPTCGKRMGT